MREAVTSGSHHYLLFSHQEYELPQVADRFTFQPGCLVEIKHFVLEMFGLSLHSVALGF